MQKALGVMGNEPNQRSSGRLDEILTSKVVEPLIPSVLSSSVQSIECYKGKQKISAYRATILPEICELMLKVRDKAKEDKIELGKRQKAVIMECDIIIRSLAKVCIIALVDEATGYQYEREKDELQKILKFYISAELLAWQKTFPDVFYKELFRLNGWDYTVNGIKKRPGVIGTWTNALVYKQLPKGVLDELKSKTPKSSSGNYTARFFQSLTPDTGNPHLTAQIQQIVTLFQLSDTMEHMWNQFRKLKERQMGSVELDLKFDDKGHTIEPAIEPDQLSSFNKNLVTALSYNPKKNKKDTTDAPELF
jgi:hypothetical protein